MSDQIALPEARVCDSAITLAFTVLGKRWNGMLLNVLGGGVATFTELRRAVPGISDTVLADRLAELTDAGLVSREVAAGPPIAVTYALTPSGCEIVPTLNDLGTWAKRNLRPAE
jgi:DNA-binding HxlR family transcriptional regulator